MRERCSPAVGRILEQLGTGRSPLTRLLAAMVAEEDGRISELLRGCGDSLERLHRAITDTALPDLTVDLTRLLNRAQSLSRLHDSEGTVTSDFFLLALVEYDPDSREFLRSVGLEASELRARIVRESPDVAPPPDLFAENSHTDRQDVARILDVNLNRAREALRVLDDYCRFIRRDPLLTEQVKRTRHDLAELSERLSGRLLLTARDTLADVGTAISTEGEMLRTSASDVARVALKRLQESLRSLEEFGKTFDATFAAGVEQIRYRSYTLEKALLSENPHHRLGDCRLYVLLTGSQCLASIEWTIAEAAAGGAGMFQLREKSLDDRTLLDRARDVRRWTRTAGTLFIMNDRPDIARLADADGVHLGQADMPVSEARRILGPDALIGVSTHDLAQVRRAVEDGADYIGVGPTFRSETKTFTDLAGLDFVRAACAASSLPAFAIGGIHMANVAEVAKAGACRIAVSAAVARAEEPRLAALSLCAALAPATQLR